MAHIDSPSLTAVLPQRGIWFCCAALLFGTTIPAQAAGNVIVSVSATVLSKNNCKFQAPGSATLAFGNLNPSSSVSATVTATLVIRCTGSASVATYALTHNSGLYETGVNLNRMKHATLNEYLPYALTLTPSSATVLKNTNQTITLSGTVMPASFENASQGAYADTVVITLSP